MKEHEADGKVTRWYERGDSGFDDIPLIASDEFKVVEMNTPSMKAFIYYKELDQDLAKEYISNAIDCSAFFAERYGDPVVKGKMIFVCTPRKGWGYSRIPMFVGAEEYIMGLLKNETKKTEKFHGNSHEIGHFWWNLADTSTTNDWINEALAEFSSLCALEQFFGRDAVNDILKQYAANILKATIKNAKPINETRRDEDHAYTLYYEKGAYIFEMLRSMLGEERLFGILRKFYANHRENRGATTNALIETFVRNAGENIRPFFEQFLNTSILPKLNIEWLNIDNVVNGKVVLKDFRASNFPLDITFNKCDSVEEETRTILVSPGENKFEFELAFEPDELTVDKDFKLLKYSDKKVVDYQYREDLLQLVHGPYMDFYPDIVPAENITRAKRLLDDWEKKAPGSDLFNMEKGWYAFLNSDYESTVEFYLKVLPNIDSIPQRFTRTYLHRNLGICYDLMGKRAKALDHYRKGMRFAEESGMDYTSQKALFGDYQTRLFKRGNNIHMAAYTGDLESVKRWLENEPSLVNKGDDLYDLPPLYWATSKAVFFDVVGFLVDRGADVNFKNSRGLSILHRVVAHGHLEAAKMLVENGADVQSRDRNDKTPLSIALDKGYTELADYLEKIKES